MPDKGSENILFRNTGLCDNPFLFVLMDEPQSMKTSKNFQICWSVIFISPPTWSTKTLTEVLLTMFMLNKALKEWESKKQSLGGGFNYTSHTTHF